MTPPQGDPSPPHYPPPPYGPPPVPFKQRTGKLGLTIGAVVLLLCVGGGGGLVRDRQPRRLLGGHSQKR